MTIQIYDDSIYFVQFKNIKLAIDFDTCVFLGEIKDGRIELNLNTKRFLLKKFKISQFYSFTKNLVHIKFLAKYSPIFSKFIDDEEFNNIKIQKKNYELIDWTEVYCIKFNNGLKFFNTEEIEIDFDAKALCTDIDSEFLKILESWGKIK